MKPVLGTNVDEILDAFRRVDLDNRGYRITEAAIVGTSLRFRFQGKGAWCCCRRNWSSRFDRS